MGERVVLGLIEDVVIFANDAEEVVSARIDTGATTSSIDMHLAEKLGLKISEQEKIVKSASGIEKRHLVFAKISIKGYEIEDYFTLADRHHMTYSVLIGQNILKQGEFIVDPLKGENQ
ncbi:ATP-dependent zinc protease [Candidatus Woesearchaeota archaeon]|nr:ATP-dependent zinc protease [Candidatus Woesearchaeota archaeon]